MDEACETYSWGRNRMKTKPRCNPTQCLGATKTETKSKQNRFLNEWLGSPLTESQEEVRTESTHFGDFWYLSPWPHCAVHWPKAECSASSEESWDPELKANAGEMKIWNWSRIEGELGKRRRERTFFLKYHEYYIYVDETSSYWPYLSRCI